MTTVVGASIATVVHVHQPRQRRCSAGIVVDHEAETMRAIVARFPVAPDGTRPTGALDFNDDPAEPGPGVDEDDPTWNSFIQTWHMPAGSCPFGR